VQDLFRRASYNLASAGRGGCMAAILVFTKVSPLLQPYTLPVPERCNLGGQLEGGRIA